MVGRVQRKCTNTIIGRSDGLDAKMKTYKGFPKIIRPSRI